MAGCSRQRRACRVHFAAPLLSPTAFPKRPVNTPFSTQPQAVMDSVRADKLREVQDGHDGTWVAHPALIPIAREVRRRGVRWLAVWMAGLADCGALPAARPAVTPSAIPPLPECRCLMPT